MVLLGDTNLFASTGEKNIKIWSLSTLKLHAEISLPSMKNIYKIKFQQNIKINNKLCNVLICNGLGYIHIFDTISFKLI